MNKIFYKDYIIAPYLNKLDIAQALHPNMMSVEESKRLGMKTVVKLYTKFAEQVKQNPGLTSYYVCYPWSACSGRMIPSLEKDFELIVSAFGWKVTEWASNSCTISIK